MLRSRCNEPQRLQQQELLPEAGPTREGAQEGEWISEIDPDSVLTRG